MVSPAVHLIDPPVGPYSPPERIRAWIRDLEALQPRDANVRQALEDARRWLRSRPGCPSEPPDPQF